MVTIFTTGIFARPKVRISLIFHSETSLGADSHLTITRRCCCSCNYLFTERYSVLAPTGEYSGILFQLLSFLAATCIFLELVFAQVVLLWFHFLCFCGGIIGLGSSFYPTSYLYNFALTRPVPVLLVCSASNNVRRVLPALLPFMLIHTSITIN
jgi:hypothetical protein